jgi:hypothetical protein
VPEVVEHLVLAELVGVNWIWYAAVPPQTGRPLRNWDAELIDAPDNADAGPGQLLWGVRLRPGRQLGPAGIRLPTPDSPGPLPASRVPVAAGMSGLRFGRAPRRRRSGRRGVRRGCLEEGERGLPGVAGGTGGVAVVVVGNDGGALDQHEELPAQRGRVPAPARTAMLVSSSRWRSRCRAALAPAGLAWCCVAALTMAQPRKSGSAYQPPRASNSAASWSAGASPAAATAPPSQRTTRSLRAWSTASISPPSIRSGGRPSPLRRRQQRTAPRCRRHRARVRTAPWMPTRGSRTACAPGRVGFPSAQALADVESVEARLRAGQIASWAAAESYGPGVTPAGGRRVTMAGRSVSGPDGRPCRSCRAISLPLGEFAGDARKRSAATITVPICPI